jgi:hypothetical protein
VGRRWITPQQANLSNVLIVEIRWLGRLSSANKMPQFRILSLLQVH